jgi:hypothetical protein
MYYLSLAFFEIMWLKAGIWKLNKYKERIRDRKCPLFEEEKKEDNKLI